MNPTTTLATQNAKNGRAPSMAKPIRELAPSVDVYENADEVMLIADMPGASAESVHVQLEGGQLVIEAERALRGESLRYKRTFQLPSTIDPDGVSAELRDGVLRVHLKKSEQAKPRVIPVRSS